MGLNAPKDHFVRIVCQGSVACGVYHQQGIAHTGQNSGQACALVLAHLTLLVPLGNEFLELFRSGLEIVVGCA